MKSKTKNEIVSLNDKLFNEFSIEELEMRLETDPLMFTSMFTGGMPMDGGATCNPICIKIIECSPIIECDTKIFGYE